jgi:hypothetical protein
MDQQITTPILAASITTLIKLWNTAVIRDKIFSFVPKLPRALQWIAPLLLGMTAAGGQGFLDGKTGTDLFVFAAASGAEIGALSIAIWHVGKRVFEQTKTATTALVLVLALGYATQGCGANLRPVIDKIVIFEQQVHSEAQNLQVAANAVIPLLPPAQQDVARARLARAFEKLTMLLTIKDNAVQAALVASEPTLDLTSLVIPVVAAIEEIILLVKSFGSDTTAIEGRALTMRVRYTMGGKP